MIGPGGHAARWRQRSGQPDTAELAMRAQQIIALIDAAVGRRPVRAEHRSARVPDKRPRVASRPASRARPAIEYSGAVGHVIAIR